ncbi:IS3 family transposase [Frankia sp. Cas3]|uniref:IS3 family transposase n=1 Tax=Frankia sp. Cas3 TaxID=3073926 RepID=UPI002AD4AA62|nr:IS3 family transposase [Frankia sp. Cas3]
MRRAADLPRVTPTGGCGRLQAGAAADACVGPGQRPPQGTEGDDRAGRRAVPAARPVSQDFTADAPNRLWFGDITYVRTWDGWAYVASVIDAFSRKVVGWAVADHMRTDLVLDALRMAITRRHPPKGVIFHADRGSQYTSKEFVDFCKINNVRNSVGRTGICFDNAAAESFWATLKKEFIHLHPFDTVERLRTGVFEYIEVYYNRLRIHSTIGYLTPVEFEDEFDKKGDRAA